MECTGRIKDGVVVLERDAHFEEGILVRVQSVEDGDIPLLADLFKDIAGQAVELPPDLSDNHNQYLHGLPERSQQ